MIEFWLEYLPVVIYFLLIALLIVLIILGVKLIGTVTKVDKIVDNINEKMESINPIFHLIDFATDRIASLSDTFIDYFTNILGKLIGRKGKDKKDDKE